MLTTTQIQAIATLDQAIANHSFRPKGIRVSTELWQALVTAGRVTTEPIPQVLEGTGYFLKLDKSIFVDIAFELKDFQYQLPSSN